MEIDRIQSELREEYNPDVVDNIGDVIDRIQHYKKNGKTYIKDVVMSSNDPEEQQLLMQSIFALMNTNIIQIDFMDMGNDRVLDYTDVSMQMMNEEEDFKYTHEGKEIAIPKSDVEMAIVG